MSLNNLVELQTRSDFKYKEDRLNSLLTDLNDLETLSELRSDSRRTKDEAVVAITVYELTRIVTRTWQNAAELDP